MTWHCDDHGEVIPQHNGTSYRCPCCTGRAVWRDEADSHDAEAGAVMALKMLRMCKCTFVQQSVGDGCYFCNPELAADIKAAQAGEET